MEDKLAVNSGEPVFNKKLPPPFPGALMIDENEINQVLEVLKNKSLFRYYGPNLLNKVKKFEEKFSEFIGTSYTLAVSSGTASLFISLKAMGLGEGDKVLVPGYTWISTPLTVVECGAKPVICDIDDSLEIDPASIEEKLSNDDIKAIIPVHMRGAPCRMDKIMKLAHEYQVKVLEDVAQSCGGEFEGKKLGSFGHMGAFSFQLNKIITSGEGGAVTTSNGELYRNAVAFHDVAAFYRDPKNIPPRPGLNFRMDEVRAAILLSQLEKINNIIGKMRKAKEVIKRFAEDSGLTLRKLNDPNGDTGAAIIFIFENVNKAKKFSHALSAEGVPCYRLYDVEKPYDAHIWINWKPVIGDKIIVDDKVGKHVTDILSRSVEITLNPLIELEDAELIGKAIQKVSSHIS